MSPVAPHADALAHGEVADAVADGRDVPTRLVARLPEGVRIRQRHAGEHGLTVKDVDVPVRAGGDGKHLDQDLARGGFRRRRLPDLAVPRLKDLEYSHVASPLHGNVAAT